jgi:aryl-alcohol dehydrogenase (NADP+)
MIPLCLAEGVGLIPWSPLARGFLAGNRKRPDEQGLDANDSTLRAQTDDFAHDMYYQDDDFKVVERVIQVAQAGGVTPSQVALAWLLHKPGVAAPIVGASKMSHLEEAVAAEQIKLSAEEMALLEEPYRPHRILGHG